MSDCWQTLGIEATQDVRAIKMAYAKLLKITRPDQDPAAFQVLHGAYEESQYLAKSEWYWDEEQDLERVIESDRSMLVNLSLDGATQSAKDTTIEPAFEVIEESQSGNQLKHIAIDHDFEHQTTNKRHVDADAAAFFDGVLLPNEWLAEFYNAINSPATVHESFVRAALSNAEQFDATVWSDATHIVLRRIEGQYNHYVKTQVNSYNPFLWKNFDDHVQNEGFPSLSVLKEISQGLQWWSHSMEGLWQKEYSSDFIELLKTQTITWQECFDDLKRSLFKFKSDPGVQHVGYVRFAEPWRRISAKTIDFLFLIGLAYLFEVILGGFFKSTASHDTPIKLSRGIFYFVFVAVYFLFEASKQRGFIGSKVLGIKLIKNNGRYLSELETLRYFLNWGAVSLIWFCLPVLCVYFQLKNWDFGVGLFIGLAFMVFGYHLISAKLEQKSRTNWVVLR